MLTKAARKAHQGKAEVHIHICSFTTPMEFEIHNFEKKYLRKNNFSNARADGAQPQHMGEERKVLDVSREIK